MKLFVKDVPETQTVFSYIAAKTNYFEALKDCKPKQEYPEIVEFEIPGLDIESLKKSTRLSFEKHGEAVWKSGGKDFEPYRGASITYLKDHREGFSQIQSSLGTKYISDTGIYLNGTDAQVKFKKNSHIDSYSFNKLTDFAKDLDFPWHLIKRTIVRSRCATLDTSKMEGGLQKWPFHVDEDMSKLFRFNVPVFTNESYMFEMENGGIYNFKPGIGYTFDSSKNHRVYAEKLDDKPRTVLVIGLSAWFDYNEEDDSWSTNEFFGKHPMDMFYDGDMIEGIRIRDVSEHQARVK